MTEQKNGYVKSKLFIATVSLIAIAIAGAYTYAQSAVNKVHTVDKEVAKVQTNEENHYKELKEDLGEIKSDVKKLLSR